MLQLHCIILSCVIICCANVMSLPCHVMVWYGAIRYVNTDNISRHFTRFPSYHTFFLCSTQESFVLRDRQFCGQMRTYCSQTNAAEEDQQSKRTISGSWMKSCVMPPIIRSITLRLPWLGMFIDAHCEIKRQIYTIDTFMTFPFPFLFFLSFFFSLSLNHLTKDSQIQHTDTS